MADVGRSAGYSRQGGEFTEAHDQIKRSLVRPLRRDAKRAGVALVDKGLGQWSFAAGASQSA